MTNSTSLFWRDSLIAFSLGIGICLFSPPADGQSFPSSISPLSCPADQERLWVVRGVEDDYNPTLNSEPMTPSAELLVANTWPNTPVIDHYDSQVSGHSILDTIELGLPPDATVMSMRISGHFRPVGQGVAWWTDGLRFSQRLSGGGDGFSPLVYNNFAVSLGGAGVKTWEIDATANTITTVPTTSLGAGSATAEDVLDAVTDNGFIDFELQDDTSVDFLAVDICYERDAPEFVITKTLDTCSPGSSPNTMQCTFELEIRNDGDPYTGELQFTEIMNSATAFMNVEDSNGAAVSCQILAEDPSLVSNIGSQPMSFSEQRLCTLPGVSIDDSDVIELDVIAEFSTTEFFGPGPEQLNCASVVMWDGQPDLAQMQGGLPSDCAHVPPAAPQFSIEKTLQQCDLAISANTNSCTYTIEITNNGGPYIGQLQIQEITNVGFQSIEVSDATGNNIPCQVYSGGSFSTTPLNFSAGAIISDASAICSIPNAAIANNSPPLVLTATIETNPLLFFGPGPDPLNCAAVVLWDGRPNGMATADFPSHCIEAYPPASATACELHVDATSPNQNVPIGNPIEFEFQITNEGGVACETVRIINYVAAADSHLGSYRWMTADPNFVDQLSTHSDQWDSPNDTIAYMQGPGNVPNFQYSFPQTPPVILGPGIPEGDLIWVHPGRRPQYAGPPVQSVAFAPGAQADLGIDYGQATADGFIVCGIAVTNTADYFDQRVALSLAAGLNRPISLNQGTGFDVWAQNTNDALAASGITNASCVGINTQ